jgi:hypothetical protein
VCCHHRLDILDPKNEVPLKYFSTSVLCHGCLPSFFGQNFQICFAQKKSEKEKQDKEREDVLQKKKEQKNQRVRNTFFTM